MGHAHYPLAQRPVSGAQRTVGRAHCPSWEWGSAPCPPFLRLLFFPRVLRSPASAFTNTVMARHTAVRTLATQKMWQPIEHLAISGASHATSWCNGHHRADLRCCSDQAFRECKHQRAKPARGRAASTGCCFSPHLDLRAWRWRERHDGRPQRVPSRSLPPETSKLISV